jgi:CrcB protein
MRGSFLICGRYAGENMMRNVILVAGGGALGATLRYVFGGWLADRLGSAFPWHTLVVNITGAFALGVLMAVSVERGALSQGWRVFLGVGLLGGYTTFSTLSYEAVTLLERGSYASGLGNMFGTGVVGLAAAIAGLVVGRLV